MRIELNWTALCNLLKDDPEAEINIRNSMIQEFARTQLKPLLNSEVFESVKKELLAEVRRIIKEQYHLDLTTTTMYGHRITVADSMKKEVQEALDKLAKNVIKEYVEKAINANVKDASELWLKVIRKQFREAIMDAAEEVIEQGILNNLDVQAKLDKYIQNKIDEGVQERLRRAAQIS